MYSDNQFEDLAYEPGSGNPGYSSTFDMMNMNDFGLSTELFSSDSPYNLASTSTSSNPLLQTIQRNTSTSSSSLNNNNNNINSTFIMPDLNYTSGRNKTIAAGDDDGDSPLELGNALLGSPQPSTIKKLKSHLSGIGGIGGYLTSPMGAFRNRSNTDNNGNSDQNDTTTSSIYSVLKPTKSSLSQNNVNNNNGGNHALNSSPLKPIHGNQQQSPACFELPPMPVPVPASGPSQALNNNSNDTFALDPSLAAPNMQRFQSAPAASTSTSRPSKSKKNNNNNNKNSNDALNVPQPPQSANTPTFNELDYAGMRIYGRPIQRSASEDPSAAAGSSSTSTSKNDTIQTAPNSSFLPYPDQLPTITLGRGVKNSRDLDNPIINPPNSVAMSKHDSEPIPSTSNTASGRPKGFTNLNKPFIQYVAPNSPAAKQARNKKSLTVQTSSSSSASASSLSNADNGSNNSKPNTGKMVPIKMNARLEMPLTPPVSAHSLMRSATLSPQHSHVQSFNSQQQQHSYGSQNMQPSISHPSQHSNQAQYQNYQNNQQQSNAAYFSPSKNDYDYASIPQAQHSATMPSFEFSLEQFGGTSQHAGIDGSNPSGMNSYVGHGNSNHGNGYNGNNSAIDFSSVLGLPSPLPQHGDAQSSAGGSVHGGLGSGLLSPPPHSAASTHSSVFSSNNEDHQSALLFGIPPPASPYFSPGSGTNNMNGLNNDPEQQQSIDQALASLLGPQAVQPPNRNDTTTPQPSHHGLGMQNTFSPNHNQLQQMFSPNTNNYQQQQQHQSQLNIGMSSPPLSPIHHGNMTSPAQPAWAPYQQQNSLQQGLLPNIDPALQGLTGNSGVDSLNQQNLNMLSPQSAHFGGTNIHHSYGNQLGNGRPISSPRRLRGMQSAPDLNALYSDASNGFNDAFGIASPSPRKHSLKRGRGQQYGDSDEENTYYQYGEGSSENEDDEEDEYQPGDKPPPLKRANSIHSGGKIDPSFYQNNNSATVASVLLPLVNPNPARLRPGPKPKTSLPNLQAAHQGVFQVSPRAPPVPAFPPQFLQQATSPNPSIAESSTSMSHGLTGGAGPSSAAGCLSPDPDTGYLKPQGGVSKDMLATFYSVGTGSKQTKKGKPQRMYICSIPGCEKEFPRKSAVESHIQTHLEDKPFACPYDGCGASFVRSHDLTRHVRIHSGSKPFQCICGKGFARGDALTRHRQRGICEGSLVPRRW